MKALLLYPEWPDTYWSFKHALRFEGKHSSFPPLGLITVSSLLPKSWEKRLVDLNVRQVTTEDLKWADVAMISAMLVQKESMLGLRFAENAHRPSCQKVMWRLPFGLNSFGTRTRKTTT